MDNYTKNLLLLMVDYKSDEEMKRVLKHLMDKKIAEIIDKKEKNNKSIGV